MDEVLRRDPHDARGLLDGLHRLKRHRHTSVQSDDDEVQEQPCAEEGHPGLAAIRQRHRYEARERGEPDVVSDARYGPGESERRKYQLSDEQDEKERLPPKPHLPQLGETPATRVSEQEAEDNADGDNQAITPTFVAVVSSFSRLCFSTSRMTRSALRRVLTYNRAPMASVSSYDLRCPFISSSSSALNEAMK